MNRGIEIISAIFVLLLLSSLLIMRVNQIIRIKRHQELSEMNKDLRKIVHDKENK